VDVQKQQQEEELFKIEKELKELLAMQMRINDATAEADKGRAGGELSRGQATAVLNATKEETLVLARTRAAVRMLAESPVFAWVLDDTAGDVREVRDKLEQRETGLYTREIERDVVRKFEELIDALKKERTNREKPPQPPPSGGPPGGPPHGKPPLVPPLAELKMIRRMQGGVNDATRRVDDQAHQAAGGKLSDDLRALLERTAQKQGDVAKVTRKLAELIEKQQDDQNQRGSM
jgi:hypothetical protein